MVLVNLGFESALTVHNVTITPDMVGASMSFMSQGREVRIELPSDTKVRSYFRPASSGADGTVYLYHLHRLYVRFDIGETRELPPELLESPRNQYELVSEEEEHWLANKREDLDDVGKAFYERWLRVLRWKVLDGSIGRIQQEPLSGFANITDWTTQQRIWGGGGSSDVFDTTRPKLTKPLWVETEQALQGGGGAPIYFDLLFDAEQQFEIGDLDLCVVQLAVACEVYMKERITAVIPANLLPPAAMELLERARVRDGKFRMFVETLPAPQVTPFKLIRDDLDALFRARNNVAHKGSDQALNDTDCLRYVNTTRSLLLLGTTGLRTYHPLTNRLYKHMHLPSKPKLPP
jgi:hypothetical protein